MSTILRKTSKWYEAAEASLGLIEANVQDYEDLDEGDKAPTQEVFAATKAFLGKLNTEASFEIEQPRINVSSNGHLALSFGSKKRSLDILFAPKVHFYLKGDSVQTETGECESQALELALKYFRLS
jgi:hypothetical protein